MDRVLIGRMTVRGALRVPEITAYFWAIKALSTAMGESTSDYLVHAMNPELAVCLGFLGFVGALALQFSMRRYMAWTYWLAVVAVGVFGTMAADVLHVGFGVPYTGVERVLRDRARGRVHQLAEDRGDALDPQRRHDRREAFYWAAVVATFAMGTAVGDLTATTFGLGYFASGLLFAASDRGAGHRLSAVWLERDPRVLVRIRRDPAARCVVRRLDGQAQERRRTWAGRRNRRLALTFIIFCLVAFLAITRRDVQQTRRGSHADNARRARRFDPAPDSVD